MIDERMCKYILSIADRKSISRAAQALFLSQPSLSRYLHSLEQKLGVTLFDRSKIPLEITPAGIKFLEYISRFQALQSCMDHEFEVLRKLEKKQLTIGTLPYLGAYILPKLIGRFVKEYPEVQVSITEYTALACERALLNSSIDLCLTNLPPQTSSISYVNIQSDPVLLVALRTPQLEDSFDLSNNSAHTPLEVDWSQLTDETFILLHPWQNMRVMADEALRCYRVTPKSIVETNSVANALNLVCCNRGVTFVCRSALHYAKVNIPLIYFSTDRMKDNCGSIILYYNDRQPGNLVDCFCEAAFQALNSPDEED